MALPGGRGPGADSVSSVNPEKNAGASFLGTSVMESKIIWTIGIFYIFLLWLQASWIICLIGAELAYSRQNSEYFLSSIPQEISFSSRIDISWRIINLIACRFNEGKEAITIEEIKKEMNIPMRIANDILYDLQRTHILAEIVHDEKGDIAKYLPAESLENITKDELTSRLANLGAHI